MPLHGVNACHMYLSEAQQLIQFNMSYKNLRALVYVAVSCGYDTWFAVRLVMDYTTSHFTWSILGYLQKVAMVHVKAYHMSLQYLSTYPTPNSRLAQYSLDTYTWPWSMFNQIHNLHNNNNTFWNIPFQ